MRKVTSDAVSAFMSGRKFSRGNTTVRIIPQDGGGSLVLMNLHGNTIARHETWNGRTYISNCGWPTVTTKERLNGLPNVHIRQKNFQWYLNGKAWDGELIEVK